jgi:hypothetical protein
VHLFGIALFISFAIAGWFYIETFSSVWCFFAAVLSAMIIGISKTDTRFSPEILSCSAIVFRGILT